MRMRHWPAALAALFLAGCAADPGESSDDRTRAADPDLIVVQFIDVAAPVASDCSGAGARETPPARFPVPADARWARFETTFASGKVGVDAMRDDATRVGFGAGASPVIVVLDEAALSGGQEIIVRAYSCEGTAEQQARVTATFRRAAP